MRVAVAVAAALLPTSAQGSQIYTFESTGPGVSGQLQLVDGAARSGLFVGTSLSELGGGVERFEFIAGSATLRTPAGEAFFSTATFEGAIIACCALSLDIAGRSAEWFGTYSVFGGARRVVTGRWINHRLETRARPDLIGRADIDVLGRADEELTPHVRPRRRWSACRGG